MDGENFSPKPGFGLNFILQRIKEYTQFPDDFSTISLLAEWW
jgi:hypothetical protein